MSPSGSTLAIEVPAVGPDLHEAGDRGLLGTCGIALGARGRWVACAAARRPPRRPADPGPRPSKSAASARATRRSRAGIARRARLGSRRFRRKEVWNQESWPEQAMIAQPILVRDQRQCIRRAPIQNRADRNTPEGARAREHGQQNDSKRGEANFRNRKPARRSFQELAMTGFAS